MSHTPGPWQVHDEDYCHDEIWGNLEGPLEDGALHGTRVCEVCELPDESEFRANARLIAAAPELLAACRKFADWINAGQPSAVLDVVADAEKAIRKAEGRIA